MPFPCGLNIYITVEAVTLIGLAFVAATSLIVNSTMAKKRKSGSGPKPAVAPAQQQQQQNQQAKAAIEPTPSPADASGPVQEGALVKTPPPPPVMKEIDTRPEISPYASPACTVPFASPLTVPKDILLRSPKLHAAYESQLPELPQISDDIGHILVHYLHTGSYESLKPKEVDTLAKQIAELRTSIRAYATARAYDLPDLMRLAEKNIEKYGEGISLPLLLEITKEAHPGLSEADGWFLDYLKSRIRPHLEDPKALLGSNLLDQISSILSPNRVLLRTVLEMFCERIKPAPEPLASPITSPGSSRPVSPPSPAASPASVLQMRSRTVPRDEISPSKKKVTAPWPLAEEASSGTPSKEVTPEPVAPKEKDVKPTPKSASRPKPTVQDVAPKTPEPVMAQPVVPESAPATPAIEEIKAAIDAELKPTVIDSTFRPSTPVRRRDRRDSAKIIDSAKVMYTPELEVGPVLKDLDPVPEPLFKTRPNQRVLREVDSGFWDFTPLENEQMKESTPSVIEIDPDYVLKGAEPTVHELHATSPAKDTSVGVESRDFATPEAKGKTAEPELPLAPEVVSRDPLDSFPETEMESDKASEVNNLENATEVLSDSKILDRISEEDIESEPKADKSKEEEVIPLEKVEPPRSIDKGPEQGSGLTVHEAAKEQTVDSAPHKEPEPAAESEATHAGPVPDNAEPTGATPAKTVEPVSQPVPEPARETADLEAQPKHLPAATDEDDTAANKSVAVADTQPPAPQDNVVKTPVPHQLSPERTRSWRKRFLKVPVLFGRGM
ncbi:hypothetical protein QBC47DRAFT_365112 [Echria macrotheca]|uniref:Uncharacterized protein n=1 Tax=Echria macrotheca TaxID=438768 RepID=A0AAJ0B5E5_9PEZI|nr:hypothetical protein QBC47DRAFT_365112 [Echria macrotheca]